MGRFNGYWWSPDSTQIAYQETDHKGVEVWHVADPAHPGRPRSHSSIPGRERRNARVKLGVVSAQGGSTTWIAWDDAKYPYLAMVSWQHGAPLLLLVQARDQKEMSLLEADLKTGKTNRLLTERSATWVNIHQDGAALAPIRQGLSCGSRAARSAAARNSYARRQAAPRRRLAGARFSVPAIVDVKGEQVAYTASTNPTESHVFNLNIRDVWDEPQRLSKDPGSTRPFFASDHTLPRSELPAPQVDAEVHGPPCRRQADRRIALGGGGAEKGAAWSS